MKPGGGKAKGAGFERQVAKLIVDSGKHLGFKKKSVYRTPQSGGHWASRDQHPSDLVLSKRVLKYFPFSVECKFTKKLRLENLLTDEGPFKKWIKQAVVAARREKSKHVRYPLIVFKWNNSPILCIIPEAAWKFKRNSFVLDYLNMWWIVIPFSRVLGYYLR